MVQLNIGFKKSFFNFLRRFIINIKDYCWIKKQLNFTKDHNDTMDYLDLIDFIEE